MKIIEIKRKNGEMFQCFVDDDDFDKVNQYKWHIKVIGNIIYAHTWIKYYNGKNHGILMHKLILSDRNKMIDHIDCNGLNNQRFNLRYCNKSQNAANSKKRKKTSSIYKGVLFVGYGWEANLTKDYKKIYLGTFNEEKEAALAYNKAALEYHGKFANLNIIQ